MPWVDVGAQDRGAKPSAIGIESTSKQDSWPANYWLFHFQHSMMIGHCVHLSAKGKKGRYWILVMSPPSVLGSLNLPRVWYLVVFSEPHLIYHGCATPNLNREYDLHIHLVRASPFIEKEPTAEFNYVDQCNCYGAVWPTLTDWSCPQDCDYLGHFVGGWNLLHPPWVHGLCPPMDKQGNWSNRGGSRENGFYQ